MNTPSTVFSPSHNWTQIRQDLLWSLPAPLLALLITVVGGINFIPFPDCNDYLAIAEALRGHGTFECAAVQPGWRSPGLPFLLAIFAPFGGYLTLNFLSLWGTVFLTLRFGHEFGLKRKVFPALFLTLSAGTITCATVPLSETPFTFFLILTLYLLHRNIFWGAGLALSMATAIRPAAMCFFVPAAVFLFFAMPRPKWGKLLAFVIAANLLTAVWCIRNEAVHGEFAYSSHGGHYLLFYKAGSYLSWRTGLPFDEMREKLAAQLPPSVNFFEEDRHAKALAISIIREDPVGYFLWAPRDILNFFQPDITPLLERIHLASGNRGTLDILRRQGLLSAIQHYFNGNTPAIVLTVVYLPFYFLFLLLSAVGFFKLLYRQHWHAAIAFVLLCGYFGALSIGNLDWRFRTPYLFAFALLATYAVEDIPQFLRRRAHH